jgi:hypothetical protein
MIASILPGLRHLRVPLASGAAWLVVAWLAWGRHLQPRGAFATLVADVNAVAAWLGAGVVLGVLAFASYALGEVWVNLQTEVLGSTRKAAWRLAPRATARLTQSRWWPNASRHVIAAFLGPDGLLPDFLPNLGVRRVAFGSLTRAQMFNLTAAIDQDLWRCSLTLPEAAPTLADSADRHLTEARFARAMAFPLAVGAVALSTAIWPESAGVWAGILVGAAGACAMWLVAVELQASADIILLAAIDLGFSQAPAITAYGLDQWGPHKETAAL